METLDIQNMEESEIVKKAVSVLKQGGLVIYPTETCYGVGVDATNPKAVQKLLDYKTKRNNKALSVAVHSIEMAEVYVELNDYARDIYKNFLPGPVTVVSKGKQKVAPFVESMDGTLGIRIPNYSLITNIVLSLNLPVTSTSANASYKKTPYKIADIIDNLSEKQKGMIDLILDAGELPKRKPSVVLNTTLETPQVLRRGDISVDGYKKEKWNSLEETKLFAKEIWNHVKDSQEKGIVFLLNGELGTGKTHFSQFLGKELGILKPIKSPTFVIASEYVIPKGTFYHLDTYRINSKEEILELEPERIFSEGNVVSIEWANKVEDWIKDYLKGKVVIRINLFHEGENEREVEYKIYE